MKCPRCKRANRESRRFCAHCGAALALVCPACKFVNEAGETFCGGCGRTLAAGVVAEDRDVQPQRRQLTVMFCDLVGSTPLSQQLDPEDLREVIRGYQQHASRVVASHDGFVARFLGDGMLIYFGYPHAHEDDPARAIRAGLDVVESLPVHVVPSGERRSVQLGVRVGIATGLVVVGDLIGSDASEEAAVVGNTPNLAARLQTIAKPNTVVVSPLTRQLAGRAFEYADLGQHRLKGFDRALHIWRVTRRSDIDSRFDAARGRRLTPLIGRAAEVAVLRERWRRAKANAGQMVFLVGESGIGKSRIAETLSEETAGEPRIRLQYQCSPYHANTALYPIIHQMELAAEFRASDSGEQKLHKLVALLEKWSVRLDEMVPVFGALLSLPASDRYPLPRMSPDQQKQRTMAALLERVRDLSAQAPLLIIFEDFQWMDPTSKELLDRLTQFIAALRILVVVTSRPVPEPAWVGLPQADLIRVERLNRESSTTMVRRILGRRSLSSDSMKQVVARADGVPLYLEELTAMLVRARRPRRSSAREGVGEIPSKLQDALTERLDQLGPARELAQTASVIGREFLFDLLAAIAPDGEDGLHEALAKLESASIIYDCGNPPGSSYAFKHALLQDAAYASLLRTRRQELHTRIAETLERNYPERVRVDPELVAHHYARAGRFLAAAKYQVAAGRRAIDRAANLEALAHANQGLEMLSDLPRTGERDAMDLGLEVLRGTACRAINGFASSEVEQSFSRALTLCERLGDDRARIDVLRGLFSCYYARGALARAAEQARQVATLGERLSDSTSTMLGEWMLGCVAFWQGDFPTARRELERAYSQYVPAEHRAKTLALQIDPGVNALFHLSCTLWILGYPDQALRTGDEAIRIARQLGQPFALAMALFFACRTRACTGHAAWLRSHLDELIALTSKYELGYLRSCARVLEGQALIERNEWRACLDQIAQAFAEFRTLEAGVGLTWARSISASAYAGLGMRAEGMAVIDEALEAADRNGEHHWDAELWRLKGELSLLPPARSEADAVACFERAIEIAGQQQAKALELRVASSLARLLDHQGKTESGRLALEGICSWFTEGADTSDIRDARATLQRWGTSPGKPTHGTTETTDASRR